MGKHNRRLAGILLSGLVAATTVAPSLAADITVDGTGGGYEGYRLLNLTTSLKTGDAHEAHEGAHGKDCYNYAYSVPAAYREALRGALSLGADASDADIIAAIESRAESPDAVRAFADAVYALVRSGAADATAVNKTFSGVEQGYWLIVETDTAGDPDARSLVMLDTAGQDDITITSKEGVPTLKKQIQETSERSSAWQNAGDFDVGDDVSFRLTGTLPENVDAFAAYKYVFHDRLSAGLQFNADSVTVRAGETALVAGEDFRVTTGGEDGCSVEVEIVDVKGLLSAGKMTRSDAVVVEYSAKFLESARAGVEGNDNVAFLEFSSDPYDGSPTSKTPEDKVVGFTYKLDVNKVDGEGEALAGAEFKLQKMNSAGQYVDYRVLDSAEGATTFSFFGLDAGDYKLVETRVPAGYNKADDVEFSVVATYDADSEDPQLTDLKVVRGGEVVSGAAGSEMEFEVALQDGSVVTAVVNSTGVHLPTTGGAGVYLLYGLGGLAVVGGVGALAIRRRRSGGDEA